MRLSINEISFLAFFLPLLAIKLLNITAESRLLMMAGAICFVFFILFVAQKRRYSKNFARLFALLLVYSVILVFTCEKQGFLFSVAMLILMKDVDMNRNVYKISFIVGLIFLFIACYLSRHGGEVIRFINGEWRTIMKRSNILYVSFTAVTCLYLLIKKNNLFFRHILCILISSYLMYLYAGARTGFVSMLVLVFSLIILRSEYISRLKFVRYSCILSPAICAGVSWLSAFKYGDSLILIWLDKLVQGRIYQGNYFLNLYDIKLFGQPIYESGNSDDYYVLDSAYLDMLICEGALFFVLWVFVNKAVIKYMYDNNRMIEVAILIMYSVYGICETFLPNCFLNISWFLYGEYLYARIK